MDTNDKKKRSLQIFNGGHCFPLSPKRVVFDPDGLPSTEGDVLESIFDLIGTHHLDLLKFAKSKGDKLAVAVNSDRSVKNLKGPNRPILSLSERLQILSSLEFVDFVISFDEDTPYELIRTLQYYTPSVHHSFIREARQKVQMKGFGYPWGYMGRMERSDPPRSGTRGKDRGSHIRPHGAKRPCLWHQPHKTRFSIQPFLQTLNGPSLTRSYLPRSLRES
jgi:rfaE bifunctional protein nucleotidyltransferase chain/domain